MNKYRAWCPDCSKWYIIKRGTTPTICPDYPEHLLDSNSVTIFSDYSDPGILFSHVSPIYNEKIDVIGWYDKVNTEELILEDSNAVVSPAEGFNSRFVMNVTSVSGSVPFIVTISGTTYSEESGEYEYKTEELTVTGTSYHTSHNCYMDKPIFNMIDGDKLFNFDLYKASCWDAGSKDFIVSGCLLTWVPDEEEWFIILKIYCFECTGRLVEIDNVEFRYDDAFKRADVGKEGRYGRLNYNAKIYGSNLEGLIVVVNQYGIGVFTLEIRYIIKSES